MNIRNYLLVLNLIVFGSGCGSSVMNLGGISAGGNKDKKSKGETTLARSEADDHKSPPAAPGLVPCEQDILNMASLRYLSRHTEPENKCLPTLNLSRPECIGELHFISDSEVRIGTFTDSEDYLLSTTRSYRACGDIIVIHDTSSSLGLTLSADGKTLITMNQDLAFMIAN